MKFSQYLVGACLATAFGASQAGMIQIGGTAPGPNGEMTTKSGACTFNFNTTTSTCTLGGATTTMSGTAAGSFVTGSSSGLYAAPFGDTSQYLDVSPSSTTPVTFTTSMPANYFGFFAGSLDTYNLVQFYSGATLVDSFDGNAINMVAFNSSASGNQQQAVYIDYFPTASYDRVVISSSANAFELDNIAIGSATPNGVPEPGSLALLGLGALTFAASRRRAKR